MTRLLLREVGMQQRLFWRSRESAFFTFLLPIILLVLLGSAYGDELQDGVKGATYLLAGLIGYGIVATAFAGLAISLVVRRELGVLKRVRGTPLPPAVYLAAVIVSTLLVIALEVVIQVVIGKYVLDASYPDNPWGLILVVVLGSASFAALGLAITGVVRSSDGSSAVVNAILLPMAFISGSFFSKATMPDFLQAIGDVLPLTYLLQLLREVFLGETLGVGAIAVLLVWGAAGFVFAVRIFKWEPREI
ncbi:MAG TPA: ABC transporter permease [Gaiellaceae bacterium]